MPSDDADGTIRLADGRVLGYREYGDLEGQPLLFFHGMPGSRVEARMGDSAARALGIRIIAPDRPGYGLSDFKRNRTSLDWPSDIVELSEAMGLDRFGVVGVSGGGAYVAACARQIPDRLNAAGIISGIGSFDQRDATVALGAAIPRDPAQARDVVDRLAATGATWLLEGPPTPDALSARLRAGVTT